MKKLTLEKIIKYSSAELIKGNELIEIEEIVIDSRDVEDGFLFIAIIGENQDGHDFLEDAVKNGAQAVIVDREIESDYILNSDISILKVNDTTRALQDIAHNYRKTFKNLNVIGITGSAGKTTTKDMIHSVLSQKYNCLKTMGNYNNHIGLPLTLLRLDGEEDFAILEMGMSGFGEIKKLAEIAFVDTGIITNVAAAHLKQLGSLENIARAKKELLDSLTTDKTAILNYDNTYTRKMKEDCKAEVIYFGFEDNSDFRINEYSYNLEDNLLNFKATYQDKSYDFYINKAGKHNIYNAAVAIVVALKYNLNHPEIQAGLKSLEFSSLRMEIVELNNQSRIINDSYNANPLAVKAALDVLTDLKGKRKIAVLASMLELGNESVKKHQEIGEYVAKKEIELLITIGDKAKKIADGAENKMPANSIISFANNKECIKYLSDNLKKNDLVLIKGSRANKLEEIVETLKDKEL